MDIDPKLMARARKMVDKGTELLNNSKSANRHHPWHRNLRLKDLRQDDGFHCLLAHIYGDYWKGLVALGLADKGVNTLTEWTDSEISFIADCGFALGREYMTWCALEAAWTEKIDSIRNPVHSAS